MTDHRFSFSILTIEVNGTPTVAFEAKRHQDAGRRGSGSGKTCYGATQ